MKVRVLFTGRSYQLAGDFPDELTLEEDASLSDALERLTAQLPDDKPLPTSCLVSVAGQHLGTLASHRDRSLTDGDEIVLIAPVAGG